MEVGQAVGVSAEAYVESAGRDAPRPFESERIAEAEALLLGPAFRKNPLLLVANGSHDDLDLEAWVGKRAITSLAAYRTAGRTRSRGAAAARGRVV